MQRLLTGIWGWSHVSTTAEAAEPAAEQQQPGPGGAPRHDAASALSCTLSQASTPSHSSSSTDDAAQDCNMEHSAARHSRRHHQHHHSRPSARHLTDTPPRPPKQQQQEQQGHHHQKQQQQSPPGSPARCLDHVLLPPQQGAPRKTLVLDLDKTLIDCLGLRERSKADFDFVYVDEQGTQAKVWTRPFLRQFLSKASQHFEVVLFTAAGSRHADSVLHRIDPQGAYFSHRLYGQHTSETPLWSWVKDLSRLGRPLHSTLLVDDSQLAGLLQPCNLVPVRPFAHDHPGRDVDTTLSDLLRFLVDKVLPAPDVRTVIALHWDKVARRVRRRPLQPPNPNPHPHPTAASTATPCSCSCHLTHQASLPPPRAPQQPSTDEAGLAAAGEDGAASFVGQGQAPPGWYRCPATHAGCGCAFNGATDVAALVAAHQLHHQTLAWATRDPHADEEEEEQLDVVGGSPAEGRCCTCCAAAGAPHTAPAGGMVAAAGLAGCTHADSAAKGMRRSPKRYLELGSAQPSVQHEHQHEQHEHHHRRQASTETLDSEEPGSQGSDRPSRHSRHSAGARSAVHEHAQRHSCHSLHSVGGTHSARSSAAAPVGADEEERRFPTLLAGTPLALPRVSDSRGRGVADSLTAAHLLSLAALRDDQPLPTPTQHAQHAACDTRGTPPRLHHVRTTADVPTVLPPQPPSPCPEPRDDGSSSSAPVAPAALFAVKLKPAALSPSPGPLLTPPAATATPHAHPPEAPHVSGWAAGPANEALVTSPSVAEALLLDSTGEATWSIATAAGNERNDRHTLAATVSAGADGDGGDGAAAAGNRAGAGAQEVEVGPPRQALLVRAASAGAALAAGGGVAATEHRASWCCAEPALAGVPLPPPARTCSGSSSSSSGASNAVAATIDGDVDGCELCQVTGAMRPQDFVQATLPVWQLASQAQEPGRAYRVSAAASHASSPAPPPWWEQRHSMQALAVAGGGGGGGGSGPFAKAFASLSECVVVAGGVPAAALLGVGAGDVDEACGEGGWGRGTSGGGGGGEPEGRVRAGRAASLGLAHLSART